jgi:hypothetical protein
MKKPNKKKISREGKPITIYSSNGEEYRFSDPVR